jgi:hypothetical protein
MKKKRVTIDEILVTYSSHVSHNYPSPGEFQRNIDGILAGKRKRFQGEDFIGSLETNVVYLRDLITEGEAFLDVLLGTKKSKDMDHTRIDSLLEEMEVKVRGQSERRRNEAFFGGSDGEFAELMDLKKSDKSAYGKRLEFTYRYLMAFKLFLFEFFNVVGSIVSRYAISRATAGSVRAVINHIELTVNYYIGTIGVEGDEHS